MVLFFCETEIEEGCHGQRGQPCPELFVETFCERSPLELRVVQYPPGLFVGVDVSWFVSYFVGCPITDACLSNGFFL